MIINESFNKKFFYHKGPKPKIRLIKLINLFNENDNSETKKIFPKSKFLFYNNNDSSKNLSNSNIEGSKVNKEIIDNEKYITSRYIKESKLKEKNSMNQTLYDTKENSYRSSMKLSLKNSKLNKSLITDRKYGKNKLSSSLYRNYKNSLLHKIRKKFLKNKDYKEFYMNKNKDDNYKNRLKNINSSFSQENINNSFRKLNKSYSKKSIVYNDSLFKKDRKNKAIKYSHLKSYDDYINREKYRFKIDPMYSGNGINMKQFSKQLNKMGKEVEKIIESTVHMKKDDSFSIIDEKKFSKKFRKKFIFEGIEKFYGKELKEKKYKNIIDKNVYKNNIQLLEMVNEEIERKNKANILNKIKEKNKNKLNSSHTIVEKFKRAVFDISSFLKQRKIEEDEFKNYKLINEAFTYPQTKILIEAIRNNDLDLCYRIINAHKYIVFDFDYFYLTPLHWAVKKNFYKFIPTLLDYGSLLNAGNILGETPLHISVKYKYYDCTCILLYYLASPFVKDKNGKTPIELSDDFEMKYLLEKIIKLHYSSYFQKNLVKDEFIQSGLWVFIKEEFHDKLKEDVFEYFKKKQIKDIFSLQY